MDEYFYIEILYELTCVSVDDVDRK